MEMLERAVELGHLRAGWVAADDASGMSPSFRDGLATLGIRYVLNVPAGFTVWPVEPEWDQSPVPRPWGAPQTQAAGRAAPDHGATGCCHPRRMPGRRSRWPKEVRGRSSYLFSAQRVRPSSKRRPGDIHWAIYRRNLDGSEPRYYLSNTPDDTLLETMAYVGGSRWRIETEFETEKGDVGLDEYETRTWACWHHHVALCLLGGAFLLSLQKA